MTKTMKAGIMSPVGKIHIEEVPVPQYGDDHVLIQIKNIGICGSDVHYWEQGKIGEFIVQGDFILGHECSGVVAEVGKNVTHLKPGDRVTVEPGATCGGCEFCMSGRYNLCPDVRFLATPPYDGSLCEYIVHPANLTFKLPDSISLEQGALVEPFAIGMYATKGVVELGSKVAILGAGCIGLVTLVAAIARGASEVYITDIYDNRLEMAQKLGGMPINVSRTNAAEIIKDVDTVIECAGSPKTVNQAIKMVKKGGSIVLVGLYPQDEIPVNLNAVISKELNVSSIFRYVNMFPSTIEAIDVLAKRGINLAEIITQRYKFEESQKGFGEVSKNKQNVVKAVIEF